MLADDQDDLAEPVGIVPARASHSDWIEPELGFSAVPHNVDMRSLQAVGRDDAESEATLDKPGADIMRGANYAGALEYVPELSWILFLRIFDEREQFGGRRDRGRGGQLHALAGHRHALRTCKRPPASVCCAAGA